MPGDNVFIDSNIFLYARDQDAGPKAAIAVDWLRRLASEQSGRTNLQVLNEVTHVMLRKRSTETAQQIFDEIDGLGFFGTAPIDESIVAAARGIHIAYRFSWWDSLLLAAALDLRCAYFLSEDLQDGQRITIVDRSLTIVDPFAHSPTQILGHPT